MAGGSVLSQSEIDKLLQSIGSDDTESNKENIEKIKKDNIANVKKYDFKRPKKFTKEHIKSLATIHDNFMKYISSYFVSLFSTQVKVEIMSTEQITFHEFVSSMPNPTIIASFEMQPLVGNLYISLECPLSILLLDSLLGSNSRRNIELTRYFSDIDKRILSQVSNEILNIIKGSWEDVVEVSEPKLKSLETNPATIQSLGPNEPILFITFKIEFDSNAYFMNLCLPYISIEKISDKLNKDYIFRTENVEDFESSKLKIRKELNAVQIGLDVILDKKIIKVSDFLLLQTGDVLIFSKNYNNPVEVYAADKLLFNGILGLIGEHKGVKILDSFYSEEVLENGR